MPAERTSRHAAWCACESCMDRLRSGDAGQPPRPVGPVHTVRPEVTAHLEQLGARLDAAIARVDALVDRIEQRWQRAEDQIEEAAHAG